MIEISKIQSEIFENMKNIVFNFVLYNVKAFTNYSRSHLEMKSNDKTSSS